MGVWMFDGMAMWEDLAAFCAVEIAGAERSGVWARGRGKRERLREATSE